MLELPLHAGVEHPNLVWSVLASVLSFLAGIGLGTYSDRVQGFMQSLASAPDNR